MLQQIESTYKKAHASIRSDPSHKKSDKPAPATKKRWNAAKRTLAERQAYVSERKAAILAKVKTDAEA